MTGASPAELLGLARAAAAEAGAMLAARRPPGRSGRPDVAATKSSPTDVVTDMDRAAEALITQRLRERRPGDAILGEESGASGRGPVRWIIDPLDGTVNYLYGLADWAVSIAAEVDGAVVAGVVTVPVRGEVFTATAGGGAWLHAGAAPPLELRCNTGVALAQALVATGFGYAAARRQVQGEVVTAVLPRVRDIRRGGSCAVDLCSVASGRVDAFYERGVNYWDYAAGGLVATEAGALLAGLAGRPASPELAIAAEPGLFRQLHDLLVTLDPERDAPDPEQDAPDPERDAPDPERDAPDPERDAPDPERDAPDPERDAPPR